MAERQMGTTIEDIRDDHKKRYEFANKIIMENGFKYIFDMGCGVGYSSYIFDSSLDIDGIDISDEANAHHRQYFARDNYHYKTGSYNSTNLLKDKYDCIVSFEFIEHIETYNEAIRMVANMTDMFIFSTPNEERMPFSSERFPHHVKHFTKKELDIILKKNGFTNVSWYSQKSKDAPEVNNNHKGRYIIAVATK